MKHSNGLSNSPLSGRNILAHYFRLLACDDENRPILLEPRRNIGHLTQKEQVDFVEMIAEGRAWATPLGLYAALQGGGAGSDRRNAFLIGVSYAGLPDAQAADDEHSTRWNYPIEGVFPTAREIADRRRPGSAEKPSAPEDHPAPGVVSPA